MMQKDSMFTELMQTLQELDQSSVEVGVQPEQGENAHGEMISSDDEMCKIAAVHEYGCDIKVKPKMRAWLHHNGIHLKEDTTHIHIPERSFIRRAYEDYKSKIDEVMNNLIDDIFAGTIDADMFLSNFGKYAVTRTAGSVGVDAKPITMFTRKRRKGSMSTPPLNDTGKLANHITFVARKGGE